MKLKTLAAALALCFTTAHGQTTESRALEQLKRTNVDLAWSRNLQGQGIKIGVIDQGFDIGHADLRGRVSASQNFYSSGPVTWGLHGTAMAGVIAANVNNFGTVGVAPQSQLLLAQVGPGATNTGMQQSSIYRALDWLSQQGVAVINMSFGSDYDSVFNRTVTKNQITGIYFSSSNYGVNYGAAGSDIASYQVATARGSILVAAAGNSGLAYSEFPSMYATRTDVNGNLILGGRMIVVGAVDNQNQIANFSNRAGHLCQVSQGLTCRDPYVTRDFFVVAPGQNLVVSNATQLGGQAVTMSGTSPAAAYVTGGVALIRQAWPNLKPEQIVNILLTTTRDLGTPGTDDVYGRGLVDFDKATKPIGTLTLPIANRNTGYVPGPALTSSAASFRSGLSNVFRSTSVIQNSQVLDSYGRNYSVNLSKAIVSQPVIVYNTESPWMNSIGFWQTHADLGGEISAKIYGNNNGNAVEITKNFALARHGFQFGTVNELGFLGNYGVGGLSLGTSNTNWLMVKSAWSVNDKTDLFYQFGRAQTQVTNAIDSMIAVMSPVISHSWRFGLMKQSHSDLLSISAGIPVTVTKGQARLSAVTDYKFIADGDEITAVPVITNETVSLRNSVQEYNMSINYRQKFTNQMFLSYNYMYSFTANNSNNYKHNSLGVMFTWIQ